MVRVFLADATVFQAAKALVRHLRLAAFSADRQKAHGRGSLIRQVLLLLRSARRSRTAPPPKPAVRAELERLSRALAADAGKHGWEDACYHVSTTLLKADARSHHPRGGAPTPPGRGCHSANLA
jgi:hypothetical protein